MGIGHQLKSIRKSKNITLTDISESTELSIGYISNIEREISSPTIDVLHKLCNALNITLNDVLEISPAKTAGTVESAGTMEKSFEEEYIVRKDDRKLLFQENDGKLSYTSMTKGDTNFKVSAMTISDDSTYTFSRHEHDEMGIVISGSMEMIIDEKSFFLYPGDSIYIKAGTMHSAKKSSPESCVSHWIKLSAELNDLAKV